MISHAVNCEAQPSSSASPQLRARARATNSGSRATKISQAIAWSGKAQAKRTPDVMARRMRYVTQRPSNPATQNLFLEQRIERLPRIVGRLRLPRLVRGEVLA